MEPHSKSTQTRRVTDCSVDPSSTWGGSGYFVPLTVLVTGVCKRMSRVGLYDLQSAGLGEKPVVNGKAQQSPRLKKSARGDAANRAQKASNAAAGMMPSSDAQSKYTVRKPSNRGRPCDHFSSRQTAENPRTQPNIRRAGLVASSQGPEKAAPSPRHCSSVGSLGKTHRVADDSIVNDGRDWHPKRRRLVLREGKNRDRVCRGRGPPLGSVIRTDNTLRIYWHTCERRTADWLHSVVSEKLGLAGFGMDIIRKVAVRERDFKPIGYVVLSEAGLKVGIGRIANILAGRSETGRPEISSVRPCTRLEKRDGRKERGVGGAAVKLNIGSININGLKRKLSPLLLCAGGQSLHIIAVQETHLNKGENVTGAAHRQGYKFVNGLYSHKRHGVGFLVRHDVNFSVVDTSLVERELKPYILVIRVRKFQRTYTLITYYMPPSWTASKRRLCILTLGNLVESIPKNQGIILMGDANCKSVANRVADNRTLLSSKGLGKESKAGVFDRFVIDKGLFTLEKSGPGGCTYFIRGRPVSKPDHVHFNGLVLENLDMKAKPFAFTGESDHCLLMLSMVSNPKGPNLFKGNGPTNTKPRFVSFERVPLICRRFEDTRLNPRGRNRFEGLEVYEPGELIETWEDKLNSIVEEERRDTPPAVRTFISKSLKVKFEKLRKEVKEFATTPDTGASSVTWQQVVETRKSLHKLVRKEKRFDAKKFEKRLAHLRGSDPARFWNLIKRKTRKKSSWPDQMFDADGNPVPRGPAYVRVFKSHFETLGNEPFKGEIPRDSIDLINKIHAYYKDPVFGAEDLNVGTLSELHEEIKASELEKALGELPNRKAGGPDGLVNEILKGIGPKKRRVLLDAFNDVLESGKVPASWGKGRIIPIPKKGDLRYPGNWRGITLIPVVAKLFARILANRMQRVFETKGVLVDEQFGFRPDRDCSKAQFVLNETIRRRRLRNKETIAGFLDLRKAFDRVSRPILMYRLAKLGFSRKIITVLAALYRHNTVDVYTRAGVSETFNIRWGVRQGCPLSPILFILYINDILVNTRGVEVPGNPCRIRGLLFADDLVVLADDDRSLLGTLEVVDNVAATSMLTFSGSKSEVVRFVPHYRVKNKPVKFRLGSLLLNEVDSYNYLGIDHDTFLSFNDLRADIVNKISKAIYANYPVLMDKSIPPIAKLDVVRSVIISTALYGAVLLNCKKPLTRAQTLVNRVLRAVLGFRNFVPNVALRNYVNIKALWIQALRRQAAFYNDLFHSPLNVLRSLARSAPGFGRKGSLYIERRAHLRRLGVDVECSELDRSPIFDNVSLRERSKKSCLTTLAAYAKDFWCLPGHSDQDLLSNGVVERARIRARFGVFRMGPLWARLGCIESTYLETCIMCGSALPESWEHMLSDCSSFARFHAKCKEWERDLLRVRGIVSGTFWTRIGLVPKSSNLSAEDSLFLRKRWEEVLGPSFRRVLGLRERRIRDLVRRFSPPKEKLPIAGKVRQHRPFLEGPEDPGGGLACPRRRTEELANEATLPQGHLRNLFADASTLGARRIRENNSCLGVRQLRPHKENASRLDGH